MSRFRWTIRPRDAAEFRTLADAREAARIAGDEYSITRIWNGAMKVRRIADGRFLARNDDR